jgi:two-component system, NtrC family, nitrogen regulation response regulator NtrX
MTQILILDDSSSIIDSLSDTLSDQGYTTSSALSPEEGLEIISKETIDLVITDICFDNSKKDGIWLVKEIKNKYPTLPCISMSGESDVYKVLNCVKEGALDFIVKPISLPRLYVAISNALKLSNSKKQLQQKCLIWGQSTATNQLREKIYKFASLNENILITGESGTGKELVSENIHLHSTRYDQPFLKVNCAALNPDLVESELFGYKKGSFTGADIDKEGYFEKAHNGTLFLDEIGDLPLETQSKLLRVLQENCIVKVGDTKEISINTRIICATHQDLEDMIEKKTFREDLYYRISTFKIHIKPLRERLDDIDDLAPFLLHQFLENNSLEFKQLSDCARKKLKTFSYPGNIRELSILVKNAAMLASSSYINETDIQLRQKKNSKDFLSQTNAQSLAEAKHFLEKEFIIYRLEKHMNNIDKTAQSLEIEKTNLYRKLKQLDINIPID